MIQAHRLRQTRERRALSQEALGKLVAKDGAYISKLERGVRVSVSTTTLERLVAALDTSADYLLGLSDQPTPAAPAAQSKGHTKNGTHTATAPPEGTPAPVPMSSSFPMMCPHCFVTLQALPDAQGLFCPACRYRTGAT